MLPQNAVMYPVKALFPVYLSLKNYIMICFWILQYFPSKLLGKIINSQLNLYRSFHSSKICASGWFWLKALDLWLSF